MSQIKVFVKKPVKVEAIQLTWSNWNEVCDFVKVPGFRGVYLLPSGKVAPEKMVTEKMGAIIPTLEDNGVAQHVATEGDWIIKGVEGEFYPCKPDIFKKTYEEVSSDGNANMKSD